MLTAYNDLTEFIDAAHILRTGSRKSHFHHKSLEEKVKTLELNQNLVTEETKEFDEALNEYMDALCSAENVEKCREHLVKELCDAIYVLTHAAVELEIDLPRAFTKIHKNNMLKLKNCTVRDDGKLIKAKDHPAVNLSGF